MISLLMCLIVNREISTKGMAVSKNGSLMNNVGGII